MCSPISFLYLALLVAGVAVALWGLVHQDRFMQRLRTSHREKWKELSQRRVWFSDGDPEYVRAQYYLWSGDFKRLEDSTLNSVACRALWSTIGTLAVLLAWVVLEFSYPGASFLACLRG